MLTSDWLKVSPSLVTSLSLRFLVFSVLNYLLKLRVLKENILFLLTRLVDGNNKAQAWEPLTHGINAHSAVAAAVAGCMMKVNINFYDILFLYRHNYTLNNSYMKDKFYIMLQLLQASALAMRMRSKIVAMPGGPTVFCAQKSLFY